MNGKGIWFGVAMALLGIVVTGMAMVARGDFLGESAAHEVQAELEGRIDRIEQRTQSELQKIYRALERIEDKLGEEK